MPPLNIITETSKPQNLEMGDEIFRENLSQRQLVEASGESSDGSSVEIAIPTPRLTRHQKLAVAILCYVNLINYMDRYTVAGLLFDIGESFDLTDGKKGLLQTAFIVVYMVMAPLYGYLGDRYNRKLLMCTGVFIWSLTTLLGSFMPNYELFLLMRCFVGIGEASYSTIAPTILSDYFVADMRSKMLAIFYFAIPVGSGLGYMVGSAVGTLAESLVPEEAKGEAWRWGLRVTPIMGLVAVLLIFFVLREPPRGEVENAQHLKPTSFWQDVKFLLQNRSYVLSTVAFTCVTYVAGALAWWGPIYVEYGAKIQTDPNVKQDSIALYFGAIAMTAGIIGVPLGSYIGRKTRVKYGFADPVVCGMGVLLSLPFTIWGILWAANNIIGAFIAVLLGQIFLNLNWAIVSDMIMYICIPTRRSSASAFQILISHTFGDAGSPYIVGLVAESFKPLISGNNNSTLTGIAGDVDPDFVQFKALQYSLLICSTIMICASLFFIWTAFYIRQDKAKCNQLIAGEALNGVSTVLPPQSISRYAHEADLEQRHQLLT